MSYSKDKKISVVALTVRARVGTIDAIHRDQTRGITMKHLLFSALALSSCVVPRLSPPRGAERPLCAVWVQGGDVYVVGAQGSAFYHEAGGDLRTSWTAQDTQTKATLFDLWGDSES